MPLWVPRAAPTDPDFSGAYVGLADQAFAGHMLASGEETIPRILTNNSASTLSSGSLRLIYATARRTESCTKIATFTGSTAAGATPTLCRVGIYEEASNGDLTLAASIANDTTLWAASNTRYERNLTATWNKVRGQRYAVGFLIVTAAANPNFQGLPAAGGLAALSTSAPRILGSFGGQTDLPAYISAGSLSGSGNAYYAEVLP